MPVTLIIDATGRVVALNDRAAKVLGMCFGERCHQAVGLVDSEGRRLCSAACSGDPRARASDTIELRGWVANQPVRVVCSRAGEQRVCTVEPLPLAPEDVEPLTPRQKQVLLLAAEGYTDPAMARICAVSEDTIRSHLQQARRRLRARSRTEAVARALVMGLLAPLAG